MTEEAVKQRFVPFLRDFYRKRYEPVAGSEDVALDNVAQGGVVADGKLSFQKEDGKMFVCTYEATSRDKVDEVKYQLNIQYFLWDCIAFASIVAAIIYIVFYQSRKAWLIHLQITGNLGLIIGALMIGFLTWYFTMQGWRKYRFIHAIAQFKLYFADEQWIALAHDVFPSPVDPFLTELRNQCIYNGFGLAIVSEENVRPLVTPSRLGIYGKDRRMVHWFTRADWYQNIVQSVGSVAKVKPPDALTVFWNRITRPLHYLLFEPIERVWRKALGQRSETYTRFMRAQGVQQWLAAAGFLIILPLFLKVISHREVEEADIDALHNWRSTRNPEDQSGYIIDGEAIPYDHQPTGVPKQYPVSASSADISETGGVQEINLSGDEEVSGNTEKVATINLSQSRASTPPPAPKTTIKTAPKTAVRKKDPCDTWKNTKGWILQESAFTSAANADARISTLKKAGFSAQKVAQTCIGSSSGGYIVYLGKVFSDAKTAQQQAQTLQKALQKAGIKKARLLVKSVN